MSILTADDHMPDSITHKHKTRDRKKDPRCSHTHTHALVHAEPAALLLLASSRTTPDDNASAAA